MDETFMRINWWYTENPIECTTQLFVDVIRYSSMFSHHPAVIFPGNFKFSEKRFVSNPRALMAQHEVFFWQSAWWEKLSYTLLDQGRSQTFQNEGVSMGAQGWAGGADWDSKWRLSIDLCTKCNFIWGARGGRVSARGRSPPAPFPLWLRHCAWLSWNSRFKL